jgi:glycine cleavage system H protein
VAERLYATTHEWLTVDGDTATVGISDFAQAQLGDVVFLELPGSGAEFAQGAVFGVVESVKAASDLYLPCKGTIVEVNEELKEKPDLVNREPYGSGWLVRVKLAEPPSGLLDEAAYAETTGGGH